VDYSTTAELAAGADATVAAQVESGPLTGAALDAGVAGLVGDSGSDTGGALNAVFAIKDRAYFTPVGLPDGALATTGELASGQPYEVTGTGTFTVASETVKKTGGSLAYMNYGPLPGDVTEFWIDCIWTDDGQGSDQNVVAVIANAPFANDYPTYADAGAHVLIRRNGIVVQKRRADGAGSTGTVIQYNYTTPIPFDTLYRFGMRREGNVLRIFGYEREFTVAIDSDMEDWWGPYAATQIVSSGTQNAAGFRNFDVSSVPPARITPDYVNAWNVDTAATIKAPGTTSVTLTASYQTVLTRQMYVPSSRAVAVTVCLPVNVASNGSLQIQFNANSNATSTVDTTLTESQAYVGVVSWTGVMDLSDFSVGDSVTVNVRLAHAGTATYRTQNSGPKRVPTILIQEVIGSFA